MFWNIFPWLIAMLFVSVVVGAGYLLTTRIYGRKTSIRLTGQFWGLVFLFLIPYTFALYFLPVYYENVLRTIFYAVLSALLISLMIAQLEGSTRIKTETTLLDLGVDPNSTWLLLFGALLLSWAVAWMTINIANSQTTTSSLARFVFIVLAGVLALYKGSSKTIFTENGIFSASGYSEWSNIRSYQWVDSKLPILKLEVTNSWITLNRARINIPSADKDTVQALLSTKLSKPENA